MNMLSGVRRHLLIGALALSVLLGTAATVTFGDELDPVRNLPLPCEEGLLPADSDGSPFPARSAKRLVHLANRCGIVGTDVEFQSRRDASGDIRDYAFLGTIGGGLRIFDITDPADPRPAGRNFTTGYQNDVQVRNNIAVLSYDGLSGLPVTTSDCLATNYPEADGQGVDVFKLRFDPDAAQNPTLATPAFRTSLLTCFPNPPGGAHNTTLHPSGDYLAISNPSSDWAVDIIDLRNLPTRDFLNRKRHIYRFIDESRRDMPGRCPAGASFECIVIERPPVPNLGSRRTDVPYNQFDTTGCRPASQAPRKSACGLWRPHDVFFSLDGDKMYVAALNSTFIVNVDRVLRGTVRTKTILPNFACPEAGVAACGRSNARGLDNAHNLELSHQADTTADGKILVISDERGGGVVNTSCNFQDQGTVGGDHFWALAPVPGLARTSGATPTQPVKLGTYFNPDPGVAFIPDPIQELFPGRPERACTSHVFRIGGNGTASPGPVGARFDGVSRLADRLMTQAWYGAGVWYIRFGKSSSDADGIKEDRRSTWGNTVGWNIQPGADTWSAKEYKGYIYAGDIARGFDVYACGDKAQRCDPVVTLTKTGPPSAAPASRVRYEMSYQNAGPAASGRAKITDELPEELRFLRASDGGTYNAATGNVVWRLGSVPAGVSDSVQLTARVRSTVATGTPILNRASFTGDATISPPTAVTVTWVGP
ncbi:MAG TPA: hypothetical protein VGP51_05520 [Nocardioidaceae bacterium]|nr:hypothetical protein [Actinomycetota bacterium]HEV8055926.1 hypothetical protein [Nocardioidaceae bacterium]